MSLESAALSCSSFSSSLTQSRGRGGEGTTGNVCVWERTRESKLWTCLQTWSKLNFDVRVQTLYQPWRSRSSLLLEMYAVGSLAKSLCNVWLTAWVNRAGYSLSFFMHALSRQHPCPKPIWGSENVSDTNHLLLHGYMCERATLDRDRMGFSWRCETCAVAEFLACDIKCFELIVLVIR